MSILEGLRERRTVYQLNKELPIPAEEVRQLIEETTELVPDAFNMKSARVVVAFGEEKIDGFRAAAGTVLYFYDETVVSGLQEQFPLYAANFPVWANQANGMLQLAVWTALREKGIGANLQHYNPVIDERVKALFGVPASWKLIAQMPFGGIAAQPEPKEKEDIAQRVRWEA